MQKCFIWYTAYFKNAILKSNSFSDTKQNNLLASCICYTKNYTPVKVIGSHPCGKVITAKVTGVDGDFCVAEIE